MYTDSDAFLSHVVPPDDYKDLEGMNGLFDFLAHENKHFLSDAINKKVTGKFKDETHGVPIKRVAAVRSKTYSLESSDDSVQKGKGKGIWKKVLASNRHKDHVRAIFHGEQPENTTQQVTTYKLRAVKHRLRIERALKPSISSHDDKRYLLEGGERLGARDVNENSWLESTSVCSRVVVHSYELYSLSGKLAQHDSIETVLQGRAG